MEDSVSPARAPSTRIRGRLVILATMLSIAAGLSHIEHLDGWWVYVVLFGLGALLQVFYGILLALQPWRLESPAGPPRDPDGATRAFLWTGIIGNVFLVLLYVGSRTTGLRFASESAAAEPWSLLGVFSKIVEIALVVCLWRILVRVPKEQEAAKAALVATPR